MFEKVLLVCGGFSDFGIAFIKHVYNDFDCIIAHCSSDSERYETSGLKKVDSAGKIIVLVADFSSEEETKDLVEKIVSLDKVVTHYAHFAAPPLSLKKFPAIKWEEYQKNMDVGFRSNVLLLQYLLPMMVKNGFGSVVILLTDSLKGAPPSYCSSYICAKYALLGLVNSLAVEYAGLGVNINAVSPGTTDTKFFGRHGELILENSAKSSPLNRNLKVEEVIGTIGFLLSDSAKSINGANIFVNYGIK